MSNSDSVRNKCLIVVFDIDGTLANIEHRLHFILTEGKKDWSRFFSEAVKDTIIPHVKAVHSLYSRAGYRVIMCTGRPENTRSDTEGWLKEAGISYHALVMRSTGDHSPDYIAKPKELKSFLASERCTLNEVEVIFEDRVQVAASWVKCGVPVFLCGTQWMPIK